jgi:hypothetical protein
MRRTVWVSPQEFARLQQQARAFLAKYRPRSEKIRFVLETIINTL